MKTQPDDSLPELKDTGYAHKKENTNQESLRNYANTL